MAWHPTWNEPPEERSRWRHVRVRWSRPGGTRGMWTLLLLNLGVFLFLQGGERGVAVLEWGSVSFNALFLKGQVWRLITFQFLHGDFNHILMNMFLFWMFGRIVEMQVGTRSFVVMYLLAGVTGGVAECLFNLAMSGITGDPEWLSVGAVGASAGVMGITMVFALMNPNAPILLFFILPIPAKWMAVGTFVLESWPLMQMLSHGAVASDGIAHAAHVGGMIYAIAWVALTGRVNWLWAWRLRSLFVQTRRRFERPSPPPRRDHPIIRGPNVGDRPGPTARDEARLDAILRKIHDGGLASLTDDERRFLRDMSERKRDDVHFDARYRRQ